MNWTNVWVQFHCSGKRFANEHEGYSEAAVKVLAQEKGLAWNIYDSRIHEIALDFEEFKFGDLEGDELFWQTNRPTESNPWRKSNQTQAP